MLWAKTIFKGWKRGSSFILRKRRSCARPPTGMTRPGSKMTVVFVLTRAMSSGPPYFSWVYCLILAAGTLARPKSFYFILLFFKYKERKITSAQNERQCIPKTLYSIYAFFFVYRSTSTVQYMGYILASMPTNTCKARKKP